MELTVYDIIKGPVVSEKAYKLNNKFKQLVLKVHQDANKPMIAQALKKIFNVEAKTIRTVNRKYTAARAADRRKNASPAEKTIKIAYITLAKGHSLNLFEQAQQVSSSANDKE